MITDIDRLYEFTLQQIAAESYFEGLAFTDLAQMKGALRRGTNRIGYPPEAGNDTGVLNEGYPGYT